MRLESSVFSTRSSMSASDLLVVVVVVVVSEVSSLALEDKDVSIIL